MVVCINCKSPDVVPLEKSVPVCVDDEKLLMVYPKRVYECKNCGMIFEE